MTFGILLLGFASAVLQAPAREDVSARLEEYMRTVARIEGFTGTVVVARDGKTLLSKGYGLANIELNVTNTPQTVFRIASITKSFTATAIMMLHDRGQLNTNDSACKYLPDCPDPWQSITIRHLLTHTSGLPRYNGPEYASTVALPVTHDEILHRLKSKPLESQPGEKFDYTNSGYYLLGMIVERLSGKSYAEFLQQEICAPLGMTHTGYYGARHIISNRAWSYTLSQDSILVGAAYSDPSLLFSAGGIWSTTEDLLRFDTALHTGKLVTKTSLAEMLQPFKEDYGYGFATSLEKGNHTLVQHFGSAQGFASFLGHYPAERVTIALLSNKPNYGDLDTIMLALSAIVFGEEYSLPSSNRSDGGLR